MKLLFNKYDKLQHLNTEKTEWKVRVRAQAVWKGVNRQTQELEGLNVIFIDDSNSRIHAFISSKICDLFEPVLKEGQIYIVSNFHVREYGSAENNRVVRFNKHIYFANHTQMKLENENLTKIQPYAFDLFHLHDADKFLINNRFLIDVVGLIEQPNPECVKFKDDPTKLHIKFKVTDGRSTLNVTFFNTLAEEFEKALNEIKEEEIVVIITSAKVNQYEGTTCLNNYPATRFYLNIDHYSVKELKEILKDPNRKEDNTKFLPMEKLTHVLTVAEIKKLTKEYIQTHVKCQVVVKKVDQKSNWYDHVCTTCGEEVNKVQGRFRCTKCVRNIPYPDKRFQLATVCNDASGVLPIVFPDDEIQRILGVNAFDLDNEAEDDADEISFPPILKQFEKKEYMVTLVIEENNVNKKCNIYTAVELNDPQEKSASNSPLNNVVQKKEVSHTVNGCGQTPPTGKSSTKVRAREKTDVVQFEMDENVPLRKLKAIKMEKV